MTSEPGQETARPAIWDTDGDFGSRIVETVYIKGAAAKVIVSDATRPSTITRMVELAHDFETRFPGRPCKAFVNKKDLLTTNIRIGKTHELSESSIEFVSAKTGEGIARSFA